MSEPSQVTLPGCEAQRGDVSSDACFTPLDIIWGVTAALGEIKTDPCWHEDSNVPDGEVRYDGRDRGDGLAEPWAGSLWMNPPYSDPLPWAIRFKEHARHGSRCIALVKLDPTTEAWRMLTSSRSASCVTMVGLLRYRVKFQGAFAKGGAPNMVVAFVAAGLTPKRIRRCIPMAKWMADA